MTTHAKSAAARHINIARCARCGQTHSMDAVKLKQAISGYKWYTLCPVTGKLIYVQFDDDSVSNR